MVKNAKKKGHKAAGSPKAAGYPASMAPSGINSAVADGCAKQPTAPKEIFDAISVGQYVWCAKDIMTTGKNGLEVGAYWGDEGEVTEKDPDTEMVNVVWSNNKNRIIKVSPQVLMFKPFPVKCGEWVKVSNCNAISGWFSGQTLKIGHPVLVLDMRHDSKGGYECLVRAMPYCSCAAWELTIPSDSLTRLPSLPQMRLAPPEELYGGYKAGDIVYAAEDIPTAGNDPPGIEIGRGDVGVVFSWSGPDEVDEFLLVCFEKRRDSGKRTFIYMRLDQLSRNPPLVRGRRVRIEAPFSFPNGTCVNLGDLGTLLECREDGDSQDLVRPDEQPGVEPFAFDAPQGSITAIVENEPFQHSKEERLMLIESIAANNEKNGRPLHNMSLLSQNLFPVLGYGIGTGLGGLGLSDLSACLPMISESLKCTMFLDRAAEGVDGTFSKESGEMKFSHQAMIGDKTRVDPYAVAIQRAAANKHVLDIGTGMMCLLARLCLRAGANTVDGVEVSRRSIVSATAGFDSEAAKHRPAADDMGNVIPDWASLDVAKVTHEQNDDSNPRLTVNLEGEASGTARSLRLFEGYSSDTSLGLNGGYTLLVHEILGDIAGTESAARVVDDIRQRGLCTGDCSFIPRSASTLIAPSTWVRFSLCEKLLYRFGHAGEGEVKPFSRYQVRHFPIAALIADPQPLEVLDFGGDLQLHQTRDLEFRTVRDDDFDGIHLHLFVQVDETAIIDVLALQNGIAPDGSTADVSSSWSTLYVRLYETPVPLPKGSRIRLQCVADLKGEVAIYSIKASVGEKGEEKHHAEYSFRGC